jgi:hypothetical protein
MVTGELVKGPKLCVYVCVSTLNSLDSDCITDMTVGYVCVGPELNSHPCGADIRRSSRGSGSSD